MNSFKKVLYVCMTSLVEESQDFVFCVFLSCFLEAMILAEVISTVSWEKMILPLFQIFE